MEHGVDYFIFDTDKHGFIKGGKEKNIKQKIFNFLLQECIEDKYWTNSLFLYI